MRKGLYGLAAIIAALILASGVRSTLDQPIAVNLLVATGLFFGVLILAVVIAFLVTERNSIPEPRRGRWFPVPGYRTALFSFVAGGIVLVPLALVLVFQDLILLEVDYVYVEAYQTGGDGEDATRTFSVELVPTNQQVTLNVVTETGSPYRFEICARQAASRATEPSRIELFRVVDGEPALTKAAIRPEQGWKRQRLRECLVHSVELHAYVALRDRYCLDLLFDDNGRERAERSCWDLVRETGEDSIPLAEILNPDRGDR